MRLIQAIANSFVRASGSTWTLAFNDVIEYTTGEGTTNTQTIPENSTLYFVVRNVLEEGAYEIYKNSSFNTSGDQVTSSTVSFSQNDTLFIKIICSYTTFSGIMDIKENNSSGRLIDSFEFLVEAPPAP